MSNSRQQIDNKMPTVVGKSKVTQVTPISPSLKTSIPLAIVENFGLKNGDILHWRLDFIGDDMILTIEKEDKKEQ